MTETTSLGETQRMDFVLPQGCMVCGGELTVRNTPGSGAHGYCGHCHWLVRPRLRMRREGLEIAYAARAWA